jgi:hypothetical protein
MNLTPLATSSISSASADKSYSLVLSMKLLVTLLLITTSISAQADEFYVLVGYTCDTKSDQLLLTYDGAYNEDGKAMLKNKRQTQWDPWALVTAKDEDHIGSVNTIHEKCQLSDGTYDVAISPSPGNFNVQGRCGAWITASAAVKKGNTTIYSIPAFENDCHDMDSPVTTRVTIRAGNLNPAVLTIPKENFYK